jgi:hypothetical protein
MPCLPVFLHTALNDYVAHVRARKGVESIRLLIGKGLELTRFIQK